MRHLWIMETDLINVRRWLLEDFKARVAPRVPVLLAQHPSMEAFDLMAAIELLEAPRPLRPEHKAFLLDQYLQERWAAPAEAPMRRTQRRLRRSPVYRR